MLQEARLCQLCGRVIPVQEFEGVLGISNFISASSSHSCLVKGILLALSALAGSSVQKAVGPQVEQVASVGVHTAFIWPTKILGLPLILF